MCQNNNLGEALEKAHQGIATIVMEMHTPENCSTAHHEAEGPKSREETPCRLST